MLTLQDRAAISYFHTCRASRTLFSSHYATLRLRHYTPDISRHTASDFSPLFSHAEIRRLDGISFSITHATLTPIPFFSEFLLPLRRFITPRLHTSHFDTPPRLHAILRQTLISYNT